MQRKKRTLMACAGVTLGLGLILPPALAQEAPPPEPAPTANDLGGFHGFSSFGTHAQGQVAELSGYLNAFREDNRIVGALSEINGPPANSRNIAAFFQRGQAATFVYGVIGGPGGARGTLPDPPPGEANAYYPTDPPEMTFAGPVTSGAGGQVVDGRFYAKATDIPTGRADGAITKLTQAGGGDSQFSVEFATAVSHTEPVEGGVNAESVSVLRQVAAGPLLIQTLVSRASAFVPAAGGDPKGIASTVVEGATVNGTPVQITNEGVVVADNKNPLGQEQVNVALAQAGFEQVRLLPSVAKAGEDGSSVVADAGTLEFVKQDQAFGAANPQGFSGGGFALGGAEASVTSRRCAPNCPKDSGLGGLPEDPLPVEEPPASLPTSAASPAPDSAPATEPVPPLTSDALLTTDSFGSSSTSGLPGSSGGGYVAPAGGGLDYSSTTAVTPPDLPVTTGTGLSAAAPVLTQTNSVAAAALGPKEAAWVRDLYLALGAGFIILYVGSRLARAF